MSRCYSCNKYAAMELCDSCFYAMNPVVTNRELYERAMSDVVNRSSVMTVFKAFKPMCGCDQEPAETQRLWQIINDMENEIDKLV